MATTIALAVLAAPPPLTAQPARAGAPAVFVDCVECGAEFLRTEITFVNHVRERKEADVHVLVTAQDMGGGGREFTLAFAGQRAFAGVDDTLQWRSRKDDTEDIVRKGIVHAIRLGLVRYVARTPLSGDLTVGYSAPRAAGAVRDRWNSWVFTVRAGANVHGEESRKYLFASAGSSADRVTERWKTTVSASSTYSQQRFEFDGERLLSTSRNSNFRARQVLGLGPHWSAGATGRMFSSTFDNTALSVGGGPALEYNVFPYSESTRRQLRVQYEATLSRTRYREETIFEKTAETLLSHAVSATLEQKQRWGSASATLHGSHLLKDPSKNEVVLFGNASVRLLKGVALRTDLSASRIRNQLSLPRRGATLEETLLQRRQLASGYSYYGSLNLSYTFGSIYNNVVNPRFGR